MKEKLPTMKEVTPLKWPDNWPRTRVPDRESRAGWKKIQTRRAGNRTGRRCAVAYLRPIAVLFLLVGCGNDSRVRHNRQPHPLGSCQFDDGVTRELYDYYPNGHFAIMSEIFPGLCHIDDLSGQNLRIGMVAP
jgi:hypothetical protein